MFCAIWADFKLCPLEYNLQVNMRTYLVVSDVHMKGGKPYIQHSNSKSLMHQL